MTSKELASRLNGREYRNEMTLEEMSIAKESGLVVVFGASADLMEFHGAIDGEVCCCDGGTAYVHGEGIFSAPDNCDECEICDYVVSKKETCSTITAIWCKGDCTWSYYTEIPHETFEILEDGEKYCRGIVFSIEDLEPASKYSPEEMEWYFNILRGITISSYLPTIGKWQLAEFISYLESEVSDHE